MPRPGNGRPHFSGERLDVTTAFIDSLSLGSPLLAPSGISGLQVYNVTDFGAKGNGGNGNSNDGPSINNTIAAANSAGGGIVYMPYPKVGSFYLSSTTIVPKSNVTLFADPGTELRGVGLTNTQLMANPAPAAGSNLSHFNIYNLIFGGNAAANLDGVLLNSWQYSEMADVTFQNFDTGTAIRLETASGTDFNNNTNSNTIRRVYINSANIGVSLSGQVAGSNTFVTNNIFEDVRMSISKYGIRFVQRCDSNYFYGITITFGGQAANAANLIFNDSATPNADVGVVNIHISGLAVNAIGGAAQATQSSFLMNRCAGIRAAGVWGGVGFGGATGTFINDTNGGTNAQSYYIELLSADNIGGDLIHGSLFTKGYTIQRSRQTIAYAATITPNPMLGEIVTVGTLTGNITVNAPAATGVTVYAGQELAFIFTQDGTGNRQVFWDAVFKTNWAPNGAAGTISVAKFVFDGTNWQALIPLGVDSGGNALVNGSLNVQNFALVNGTLNFAAHLVSSASGTPGTSNLGANVTSATFTGNDTRGTIAIVMSAGLAANTRVCTCTFANTYGATGPKITLVDQTSTAGLAIVNSYVLAQSTGVSFDLAFDQALVAGTYTIDYIVIG